MEQLKIDEKIVDFCTSIRKHKLLLVDSIVKESFEKAYESEETTLPVKDHAKLLALLEKHNLLDKPKCVNKQAGFYQAMYKKMNINAKS